MTSRNAGDPDWFYHALLACQVALLPPFYGAAHNAGRPFAKTLVLMAFLVTVVAATLIYLDLVPPREVPTPEGFELRPEMRSYLAPPALLGGALLMLTGHWCWSVWRRRSLTHRSAGATVGSSTPQGEQEGGEL